MAKGLTAGMVVNRFPEEPYGETGEPKLMVARGLAKVLVANGLPKFGSDPKATEWRKFVVFVVKGFGEGIICELLVELQSRNKP